MRFDKCLIYGAREHGIYIERYLQNEYDIETLAFIDGNADLHGMSIDGKKVISLDEAVNRYSTNVAIVIGIMQLWTYTSITDNLRKHGYNTLFIMFGSVIMQIDAKDMLYKTEMKIGHDRPVLDYLETHIADHCNLKCRGCLHFSNMHEPQFADIDTFSRDMQRLAELFEDIIRIRLMGGEPLLNPDLFRFLPIARGRFPKSDIRIVTNGLLITQIENELIDSMRKNHVIFDITAYPPTMKHMGEIRAFLEAEGIGYVYTEAVGEFRKTMSRRDDNNAYKAMRVCMAANCHFLREGKLSKCPMTMFLDDFNDRFGTNYHSEDSIDIYSDIDPWIMVKRLDAACDFCSHCPDEDSFQPWAVEACDWKEESWYAE